MIFQLSFSSSGVWYTIEDGLPSSKLTLAYKESFQFNEVNGELTSILDQSMKGSKVYTQYATSFLWQVFLLLTTCVFIYLHFIQLLILSVSTIKKLIRNPMVSIVQVYYNYILYCNSCCAIIYINMHIHMHAGRTFVYVTNPVTINQIAKQTLNLKIQCIVVSSIQSFISYVHS